MKKIIITFAIIFLLTECKISDPIHHTVHPGYGKITLTTDWSNRTDGVAIPTDYIIKIGDYSATLTGTVNTVDNLFIPDTYRTYIYNTANNITISGTLATANYSSGMPGWLFTYTTDAEVKEDTDHHFTANMTQQVRQLTLVIEPSGATATNIIAINATLSGIAGSFDMDGDTHSTPSDVSVTFTKGTDGKWRSTLRLFGVTGSQQKLKGKMLFSGGNPSDLYLESDLTTVLTGFNGDKKTPLTLGGTAVQTQEGLDIMATINDWNTSYGGSVIAK